jgi:hypothetical protein
MRVWAGFKRKSWVSGLLVRVMCRLNTNVSEDRAASIFRVEYPDRGSTVQKIKNCFFTAVITSNLAWIQVAQDSD